MTSTKQTYWEKRYDPTSTSARQASAAELDDGTTNIACAYNTTKEMHMLVHVMPKPQEGEVLVHVRATGICGSDVHFWKDGRIGDVCLESESEVVAGHESAGEVVAIGAGVTGWAVGDRAAIEAGIPCGRAECVECLRGAYNQCRHMVFHSSPPYHGTLTRHLAHPAAWLHRLPEGVSFEEGALCEPLAVALSAVEKADLRLGDPTLICGAGPIGLLNLLCARAAGAYPLILTDVVPSRLEFAKTLVPYVQTVVVSRDDKTGQEAAGRVREICAEFGGGNGISVALECTGFEASVGTAVYSCRPQARVVIVGVGPQRSNYPFDWVSRNEIRLDFVFRYTHQYPKALRLIAGGILDVKPLVTHRFELNKAIDAFHVAADPRQGASKVQIVD